MQIATTCRKMQRSSATLSLAEAIPVLSGAGCPRLRFLHAGLADSGTAGRRSSCVEAAGVHPRSLASTRGAIHSRGSSRRVAARQHAGASASCVQRPPSRQGGSGGNLRRCPMSHERQAGRGHGLCGRSPCLRLPFWIRTSSCPPQRQGARCMALRRASCGGPRWTGELASAVRYFASTSWLRLARLRPTAWVWRLSMQSPTYRRSGL